MSAKQKSPENRAGNNANKCYHGFSESQASNSNASLFLAEQLANSGIPEGIASELGINECSAESLRKRLGWCGKLEGRAMVIPYPGTDYIAVRFERPPAGRKYLRVKGAGNKAFILPKVREYLQSKDVPVYITEGEKKAIKSTIDGLPCVALAGIDCFKEKDCDLLPELVEICRGREVVMIYDSDASLPDKKRNFNASAKRFANSLEKVDASLYKVILPDLSGQSKVGIDDYLISGNSIDNLKAFIRANKELVRPDSRSKSSADNGAKGGRPSVDTFGLAKAFLDTQSDGEIPLLREHKGEWLKFDGISYNVVPTPDIEKDVTAFLQANMPKSRISGALVRDVILNLESFRLCGLPAALDSPMRISTGTPINELLVMSNGALPVESAAEMLIRRENPSQLLIPHDPDLLTTFKVEYPFSTEMECPKWVKYLEDVLPCQRDRGILQMVFGLSLISETKWEIAVIFYGEAGTGKSVALSILTELVGRHNVCTVPLASFGRNFATYPLTTSLLNVCGDMPTATEDGRSISAIEGFFKDIVSGGLIPVERKHRDGFTAKAIARNIFATNSLPHFTDRSNGIWDRLRIIPFNQRIRGTDRENRNLKTEIISEELPGVFIWALWGLAKLNNGLKAFPESEGGLEVKEAHRASVDHERTFLVEHCRESNGSHIPSKGLYQQYREWVSDNGYRSAGESKFSQAVNRAFPGAFKDRKNTTEGKINIWVNLETN